MAQGPPPRLGGGGCTGLPAGERAAGIVLPRAWSLCDSLTNACSRPLSLCTDVGYRILRDVLLHALHQMLLLLPLRLLLLPQQSRMATVVTR